MRQVYLSFSMLLSSLQPGLQMPSISTTYKKESSGIQYSNPTSDKQHQCYNESRTLTDGNESGAALELVLKALANKYPAAEKSFQNPTSSLEKKLRTASISPFSKAPFNPTKVATPTVTRLLYLCFAYKTAIQRNSEFHRPRLVF